MTTGIAYFTHFSIKDDVLALKLIEDISLSLNNIHAFLRLPNGFFGNSQSKRCSGVLNVNV